MGEGLADGGNTQNEIAGLRKVADGVYFDGADSVFVVGTHVGQEELGLSFPRGEALVMLPRAALEAAARAIADTPQASQG